MHSEEIAARVHRVTLPHTRRVRGSRVNFHDKGGVWDNDIGLVGVSIEAPKLMGQTDCIAIASFTLDRNEQRSDEQVRAKADIAFAAIENAVIVKIRPISRGRETMKDGAA